MSLAFAFLHCVLKLLQVAKMYAGAVPTPSIQSHSLCMLINRFNVFVIVIKIDCSFNIFEIMTQPDFRRRRCRNWQLTIFRSDMLTVFLRLIQFK